MNNEECNPANLILLNENLEKVSGKELELPREFNRINENIESLISTIKLLETKLNPIMVPERPVDVSTKEETEPNTEIGRSLRNLSDKILKESNNIREIIDRLEI